MTDEQVRRLMVDQFGLRMQPHMTRYLLEQLQRGDATEVALIAAEARTGLAVRKLIAMQALHQAATRGSTSDPLA